MRVLKVHLTNFLSYKQATLELGDFTALVGPNASGKSNAVAALKLLREVATYGLPLAMARRGGFDQLRHRSRGHPNDPAIGIEFQLEPDLPVSRYQLSLGALAGRRYEVKRETIQLHAPDGFYDLTHRRGRLEIKSEADAPLPVEPDAEARVPPGQSVLGFGPSFGSYYMYQLLSTLQTVQINPTRVSELQDPASTQWFEPDGSNTASFFEQLSTKDRQELLDELNAIVPGIHRIEPRRFSDKLTVAFYQLAGGKPREFLAKQMSDGTLRAFGILLSMLVAPRGGLIVIEEPEIAIHLGALRTLVDVLKQHSEQAQVLITTHSADILDALDLEEIRIVWWEDGQSRVAPVADHTREPVRKGLITPGELLRSDALDPAPA